LAKKNFCPPPKAKKQKRLARSDRGTSPLLLVKKEGRDRQFPTSYLTNAFGIGRSVAAPNGMICVPEVEPSMNHVADEGLNPDQ